MAKLVQSLEELLEGERVQDDEFRAEWLRLAPAREFAAMVVGHRADHVLSQRALAKLMGVSQARIARMESGEQNPDFETIISVVGKLGTEFVIDVAPAGVQAQLVTEGTRAAGSAVEHGDVAVLTATTRSRPPPSEQSSTTHAATTAPTSRTTSPCLHADGADRGQGRRRDLNTRRSTP